MRVFGLMTALVGFCTFVSAADAQDWKAMLEKKTFTDKDGKTLQYRLLKPDNYDPQTKYPLVLFLHGAGERGKDNERQLIHGVRDFAKKENRKKHPCILIAPQCPAGAGWGGGQAKLVLDLIPVLEKELSIDPKRIYITGLSMGGYGTWDIITRNPDLFGAAVPVCGGGDPAQAEKIAKIPIWAFHGGKDPVVKPERSREMVEALKKAGGEPKYTEYPDVGHNSWVKAYQDADMMAWLFAQKKK